MHTVELWSYN